MIETRFSHRMIEIGSFLTMGMLLSELHYVCASCFQHTPMSYRASVQGAFTFSRVIADFTRPTTSCRPIVKVAPVFALGEGSICMLGLRAGGAFLQNGKRNHAKEVSLCLCGSLAKACLTHGNMTSACRLEGATKLSKEGFTNLVYCSITPWMSRPRHATSRCILQSMSCIRRSIV